jgi:hypothetical protein
MYVFEGGHANSTILTIVFRRYYIPGCFKQVYSGSILLFTLRICIIPFVEVLHFVFSSLVLKRKRKRKGKERKKRLQVILARPHPTSWTATDSYVSSREGELELKEIDLLEMSSICRNRHWSSNSIEILQRRLIDIILFMAINI